MSEAALAKLRSIRTRKDLSLRTPKHMKETFTDFDGSEKPLKIRYYQVQGILHLVAMKRFLLGDDTGLGKTAMTITALCFLWEKKPDQKVLILTTKSATPQWAKEFAKFTRGIRVIVGQGTKAYRAKCQEAWRKASGPAVLIMGYRSAVQDITQLQDDEGYVVVFDEATAFKTVTTQVHQVCAHLSRQASRAWALTATLIKNHLMEGHGIYNVVVPGLFGSKNSFMYYYCIVEMMRVGRGRRVPKIVGYHPDRVKEFREAIDLYYLGRPKHEVAPELPPLITKNIEVPLTKPQESKYREALSGCLTIGETREAGEEEERETTPLTAITYCQQVVDDLDLLECDGKSSKLPALIDMLTEGDLADMNVIVFSKYRKMVDLLMPAFKKAKIKAVRVTGSESGDDRQAAQDAFQDPTDPTRVICITMAGGDAINLQSAEAIVFFDMPWSAGDYIQIIGRMVRIGSIHARCLAVHLMAKGPTLGPTVDHRVYGVLGKKMGLIEAALGARLKGFDEAKGQTMIQTGSEVADIFTALQADARNAV